MLNRYYTITASVCFLTMVLSMCTGCAGFRAAMADAQQRRMQERALMNQYGDAVPILINAAPEAVLREATGVLIREGYTIDAAESSLGLVAGTFSGQVF